MSISWLSSPSCISWVVSSADSYLCSSAYAARTFSPVQLPARTSVQGKVEYLRKKFSCLLSMAAAAAAAAILRFRNLRHAKVPSMINATNSPEHTIAIAVLSLGARLVRDPLVGETVVLWYFGWSITAKVEKTKKMPDSR